MILGFSPSQLAYFVEVAEAGQISRAARTLYMAQPALSQSISRLERQVGVDLLVRHPRGVSLTPAGAVFLEKAKLAVDAEADALATARALARADRAVLEVGFLGSPPPLTAPLILDAFGLACPHADVSFRELRFPGGSTAEWLVDVDVAICFSPPSHPEVESQPLWDERRSVLLRSTHRLASRSELSVAEVLEEPFYRFHPSVDRGWAGFWNLDDHRGGPPQIVTSAEPTNSLELVAALLGGGGISAVPWTVAQTIAAVASGLVAIPLRDAAPAICSLVWRSAPPNELTKVFVEAARSTVGPLRVPDEAPAELLAASVAYSERYASASRATPVSICSGETPE
ncbi:MAG TPA: LysR family transcriptional regulator [Solirubrobacteraceae bacterium]